MVTVVVMWSLGKPIPAALTWPLGPGPSLKAPGTLPGMRRRAWS